MNCMGVCLMTGAGVRRPDAQRAVECFSDAAQLGDASAMVNLANALSKGEGVERDEAGAFE